jgi:nucleoside-diphosphate-sugar epimerase
LTIVTGATGWLGRSLIAALVDDDGPFARSTAIRALVGPSDRADLVVEHPRVERVSGDVRRAGALRDLFRDLSATTDVIHAAGVIHPATVSDFVEVNSRGTQHVAGLARRAGVRRLVHVSSNSPFGTNPHPGDRFRNEEPYHPYLGYGRSKMLAELRVLDEVAAGLDAVIVRPPWFYGPRQPARQTAFFTMVRTGRFPIFGDGRQRRSMVYVGNLVQGIVRAELTPTPPGRGWWIADADIPTVNDIVATVRLVLREAGLEVTSRQVRLPAVVSTLAERADRLVQRAGRYSAPLHVLGELDHTIACDISVARAELGYDPDVALAEGMRRSVQWCLANRIRL